MNEEDFAKIVRATNGQQVLVYYEPDTESDEESGTAAVIHCIARMDFGNVDLKAYATSDEGARRFVENVDQHAADRFIQRMEELMEGASNEVE